MSTSSPLMTSARIRGFALSQIPFWTGALLFSALFSARSGASPITPSPQNSPATARQSAHLARSGQGGGSPQTEGDALPLVNASPCFNAKERSRISRYWAEKDRLQISSPSDNLWEPRLTPGASLWFFNYMQAVGGAKLPPTQDAGGTLATSRWDTWVNARLAYDQWRAQCDAAASNEALLKESRSGSIRGTMRRDNRLASRRGARRQTPADPANPPPDPGPCPDDLVYAVGSPPPLCEAIAPRQYTISFDDGDSYIYLDNVPVRPRYAYYRFAQGVMDSGTPLRSMSADELNRLFADAGLTSSEQRIARAVSIHEGGFDAINTYDTGYVSVGFLQFITHQDGKHSLCSVLQQEKLDQPRDFEKDFRQYGIDVDADRTLSVIDPATGNELHGQDAVTCVIEDKRLTAVFQRAGRHSRAFRVAQIKIAKAGYWPALDPVQIRLDSGVLTCRAGDIIRSEAGLATLFDRKINRGNIEPLSQVTTRVMRLHGLKTVAEAAKYEAEIIAGLKYRSDYLADATLGQPAPAPKPPISTKSGAGKTKTSDPNDPVNLPTDSSTRPVKTGSPAPTQPVEPIP